MDLQPTIRNGARMREKSGFFLVFIFLFFFVPGSFSAAFFLNDEIQNSVHGSKFVFDGKANGANSVLVDFDLKEDPDDDEDEDESMESDKVDPDDEDDFDSDKIDPDDEEDEEEPADEDDEDSEDDGDEGEDEPSEDEDEPDEKEDLDEEDESQEEEPEDEEEPSEEEPEEEQPEEEQDEQDEEDEKEDLDESEQEEEEEEESEGEEEEDEENADENPLENTLSFCLGFNSIPKDYFGMCWNLDVSYRNYFKEQIYWLCGGGIGRGNPNGDYPYSYQVNGANLAAPCFYGTYTYGGIGLVYNNLPHDITLFSEFALGVNFRFLYNNSLKNAHFGKLYTNVLADLSVGASWKWVRASLGVQYDTNWKFVFEGKVGMAIPIKMFRSKK